MSDNYGLPSSTIKALRDLFSQYSQIEEVLLYGSRATGTFKSGSDIDLTLKGENLNLDLLLKIETEIDDLMLPYKVDLSLYEKIDNTELLNHIDRIGINF